MRTIDTNATFDIESGAVGIGDLVKNFSEKKYYDITGMPDECSFDMKYVGFWRNTKYRFQDWFKFKRWIKTILKRFKILTKQ